jgi:hypothetical protein
MIALIGGLSWLVRVRFSRQMEALRCAQEATTG